MLKHPVPFDFLANKMNGVIQDEKTTFIPYQQMYDIMCHRLSFLFKVFDLVKTNVHLPIYHVDSPPPFGDNGYILKHLDTYFNRIQGCKEIAPRSLRKKIWRLHSRVYEDYCKVNGVGFIPVPPSTLDEEGFLKIEGYSGNATHGNVWYGEQVLNDVVQRFAASE